MKLKKSTTSLATFVLIALFFFLPFSSWLVSITGKPSLSLVRDVLVIFLFLLGLAAILFTREKINNKNLIFISSLFILWGLLTFFWKEASALQWLRGFRFTFVPVLLLISLQLFDFSKNQRKNIYWSVFLSSLIVLTLTILEFFKFKIPLISEISSEGSLNTIHAVGGEFTRLQSVLAGPNALGLYLLSIVSFLVFASAYLNKNFLWFCPLFIAALVLTFSRSSWIGLLALFLLLIFYYLKKRFGSFAASSWFASFVFLISLVFWFGYQSVSFNSLITHGASSTERVEQYRRVWDQRYEIGILGRGMGTAGPSSQNRIDGGPNHWTENIYFDMFEETGLIGLSLFLIFLVILGYIIYNKKNIKEDRAEFSLLMSFLLAGLFINIYTGQAGLYLLILMSGLAIGEKNGKNLN
ncbi:MAG: O-antigen ligase family protein [Patescibacteria group bacterium]